MSWCPLGWNNRAVYRLLERRCVSRLPLQSVERVDGRAASRIRTRLRQRERRQLDAHRRAHAQRVRRARRRRRMCVGHAVPRSSAPIRSVGGRAAPSNTEGGSFRGSRAAPGASTSATGDAAAAFRSRRSASGSSSGTGYPAPAREPRSMSSLPAPARPSPARGRRCANSLRAGRISSPDARSTNERRAVPRNVDPSAPARDVSAIAVATRAGVPGHAGAPPRRARAARPDVYRAVPRSERTGRSTDLYAPAAPYGGTPDRTYRSPSQDAPERSPRAMPRSAPDNNAPPAGAGGAAPMATSQSYRSRPGPERSAPAPSGPPPQSAAPSRPSGPPSGSSGGGESRSRSGNGGGGGAGPSSAAGGLKLMRQASPRSAEVARRPRLSIPRPRGECSTWSLH